MNEEQTVGTPTVPVCYRHPNRETYVRCVRCDRPICPDCMREAAVGFQCPECVAAGRRSVRPVRTAFGGGPAGQYGWVTYTLIALNVLVAVASLVVGGGAAALTGFGDVTPIQMWGGVIALPTWFPPETDPTFVDGVAGGEYWRLVTAMFIHFGILHLGLNMWVLWILGPYLESALGPLRFLALYLLAGLGGDVAAYLFSNEHALTAGASGAIFGLFAALFVINRRLRLDTSGVAALIGINLVFGFVIANVSWIGHLGGLVTGAVVALGMAYAPRSQRGLVQGATVVIVLVALVGATLLRTSMLGY